MPNNADAPSDATSDTTSDASADVNFDRSPAEPGRTTLGFVGLGVMGRPMCRRLIDAGYAMTVFTRTRDTASDVLDAGAAWADSPADVTSASDIVFTIVGYPSDVRQVTLGESGLLAGAKPGAVLVDMTTSEPSLAVEIAEACREKGVAALDAPVSGGDVGAKNGALSIMVGGQPDAFARVRPCLDILGKTIVLQGPAGSGQHTKMVNQTLIATNMIGVCEALVYAAKAGLDPETVLKSVGGGAAGAWSLSNLAPRILQNDYAPGFYVEHFLKDMSIALAEAKRMSLSLPGLALAEQLYLAVAAQGGSRKGTQALAKTLADLNGVDVSA